MNGQPNSNYGLGQPSSTRSSRSGYAAGGPSHWSTWTPQSQASSRPDWLNVFVFSKSTGRSIRTKACPTTTTTHHHSVRNVTDAQTIGRSSSLPSPFERGRQPHWLCIQIDWTSISWLLHVRCRLIGRSSKRSERACLFRLIRP
jgi:hypothetical protein